MKTKRQTKPRCAARIFPALALMYVLPMAVQAGTFSPPKGCEGYVTVQMRSCQVTNFFRCNFDDPGVQNYVEFDSDGVSGYGKVDAEYQWLENWNYVLAEAEYLQRPATDPASFTGMLATGSDSYDFTMKSASGALIRYTGIDRLTGRSVKIDGVTLEETSFDMLETYQDGSSVWRGKGVDFIHREWRIFLAGQGAWSSDDERNGYDYTPVTFTFPGENGFFTSEPHYDCDPHLAAHKPREEPQ